METAAHRQTVRRFSFIRVLFYPLACCDANFDAFGSHIACTLSGTGNIS
jgi:hypothetical protein